MILTHSIHDNGQMSHILNIAIKRIYSSLQPANSKHLKHPSLDIPSIPQIIKPIKNLKAVTEESKLAEAARDA